MSVMSVSIATLGRMKGIGGNDIMSPDGLISDKAFIRC